MKAIFYGALALILVILLFYVVSQGWYFIVSPMELITVNSIEADGRRVDKLCKVVRVGGEYLIPAIAAAELFGLSVKMEEDELFMTDKTNFHIRMKMFDSMASVNGKTTMLRVPPMLVEMPMAPVRFFEKVFSCKLKFDVKSEHEQRGKVKDYLRDVLTSPLSILNIAIGIVYTVLWISLRNLTRSPERENRTWHILSKLTLILTILLYIVYVITSKIESRFFY